MPRADESRQGEVLGRLWRTILTLRDEEECREFFTDLCTIWELEAMSQRLEVARQLFGGATYDEVAASTGASSATISRVKRFLVHGSGGYRLVLARGVHE